MEMIKINGKLLWFRRKSDAREVLKQMASIYGNGLLNKPFLCRFGFHSFDLAVPLEDVPRLLDGHGLQVCYMQCKICLFKKYVVAKYV
jgi:hypothetical protein